MPDDFGHSSSTVAIVLAFPEDRTFGPENGSPSATNVVLVVLVVVVLVVIKSAKAFSFHNQSSPNFAYR